MSWSPRLSRGTVLLVSLVLVQASPARSSDPAPPAKDQPAVVDGDMVAIQVRLDRAGFSPGEIDGQGGANTRRALSAFQRAQNLEPTGQADERTLEALRASDASDPLVPYAITDGDLAGPFVPAIPEDLMEQATLEALGYTSVVEMLGERFHASPRLLQRLNPAATFATAGETLVVPNVKPPPAEGGATPGIEVIVSEGESALTVRSREGGVVFHAPVTTGSEQDPLPIGDWKVVGIARNPPFHYNPDLFWDADPAHAKAKIAPGPNNPVGAVWIDLSREHYGLHGTPEPRLIARSASHGCVRMTNWDALRVAAMVAKGTPVRFVP